MGVFITIFCIAFIAGVWVVSTELFQSKDSKVGEYIDLGDNCWITPEGWVDLTPKLTISQEMHNRQNKWKEKMRDDEYESDLAWAEIEQQIAQYNLMKDEVEAISPMEKLEVWLPKWIDYLVDWKLKEKSTTEAGLGYMPFYTFIATEIIPFKSYGMKMVHKETLGYIEYVV